jgi:pimeloyl-ACP methyl ester carboxylesterase
MVTTGRHRIEATVFGAGLPAVVIEPAFGGSARDWRTIAEALAADTTVVTYDRVPYGASSRASDRRLPGDVAADLDAVLGSLEVRGPLVLVGHSLGGVYVRNYAARHLDRVAGMVLVDSTHEAQRPILREHYSLRKRVGLAFMIPQLILRTRQWRGGADRRSMIREYRMITRLHKADRALTGGALGSRPLIVLTRASENDADAAGEWQAWRDLQRDLAQLSTNSRHVISGRSEHHLNTGDPELVIGAIREVVKSARTGMPLGRQVAASDGE